MVRRGDLEGDDLRRAASDPPAAKPEEGSRRDAVGLPGKRGVRRDAAEASSGSSDPGSDRTEAKDRTEAAAAAREPAGRARGVPAAESRIPAGAGNDETAARDEPATDDDGADAAARSLVPLEPQELRAALEAVLFSVADPVSIRALAELFGVSVHDVRSAVEDLRCEYVDSQRSFRIEDIAGGVQILTLSRFDPWIRRFRTKEREGRLSGAALETLAVVAYKQPITKADLEAIRGVGCGPILKTLLDRGLAQIVGRAETLGRPLLYGTTHRFLESFGLHSIRELPQPELAAKLEAESRAREAGGDGGGAGEAEREDAPAASADGASGGDEHPIEPTTAPRGPSRGATPEDTADGLERLVGEGPGAN